MKRSLARITLSSLLVALLAAACFLSACGGTGDASADPDRVRARVNGGEVRQSAVDTVRAEARFDGRSTSEADALDEAIARELVRQEARRLDLRAGDAAVDERVAVLTQQAGDEEALSALLDDAGMTRAQLRESLEYGLLREAVYDARFPGVVVGERRVRRFYERNREALFTQRAAVRLAAIFVRNEGIAGNAQERIRGGQGFGNVSRQFSIDPQLKAARGDMGWIDPASLPGDLAAVVEGLAVREVSEPVEGAGGWYIFKLLDRRDEKVTPFDEVSEQIGAELTGRARAAALDEWLDKARDAADIVLL